MKTGSPSLVWFRQDLRLADNPALRAAAQSGRPVAGIYVLDDATAGRWKIGGAGRWWLHQSLVSLRDGLAQIGVPLILRRGPAAKVVPSLTAEIGGAAVFWNRAYEPFAAARDREIEMTLQNRGVRVESFNGTLLAEPWTIKTAAGGPFRVFTPFWRALRAMSTPACPDPSPGPLAGFAEAVASEDLGLWGLMPKEPDWASGIRESWQPGEAGAQSRLGSFIASALETYAARRDLPGSAGVSRLSPHLHWGEVSSRQVWHAAEAVLGPGAEPYLRQLAWREFCHHLLWQAPTLPEKPFHARFGAFPWRNDDDAFRAWRRGMTGYPLIDAGMRELWQTGWMHNRVRMAAASFLVKHLLIDWRRGEEWYWDTLVDADLANNAANWQWVAGSGADAAPFFRIFNPVLQGEKFDPDGAYVRRYVPELAQLPNRWLHRPWEAPAGIRSTCGITLGRTYPAPIVDHATARQRALAAFAALNP